MLRAICLICLGEWVRALRAYGRKEWVGLFSKFIGVPGERWKLGPQKTPLLRHMQSCKIDQIIMIPAGQESGARARRRNHRNRCGYLQNENDHYSMRNACYEPLANQCLGNTRS